MVFNDHTTKALAAVRAVTFASLRLINEASRSMVLECRLINPKEYAKISANTYRIAAQYLETPTAYVARFGQSCIPSGELVYCYVGRRHGHAQG